MHHAHATLRKEVHGLTSWVHCSPRKECANKDEGNFGKELGPGAAACHGRLAQGGSVAAARGCTCPYGCARARSWNGWPPRWSSTPCGRSWAVRMLHRHSTANKCFTDLASLKCYSCRGIASHEAMRDETRHNTTSEMPEWRFHMALLSKKQIVWVR